MKNQANAPVDTPANAAKPLSEPQLSALRRILGFRSSEDNLPAHHIHAATLRVLRERGLVRMVDDNYCVAITYEGAEALKKDMDDAAKVQRVLDKRNTAEAANKPAVNTAALARLVTARNQAAEAVDRADRAKDAANRALVAAKLAAAAIEEAIAAVHQQ